MLLNSVLAGSNELLNFLQHQQKGWDRVSHVGPELAGLHQHLPVPRGSGAALEGHPSFPGTRKEGAISWERKHAAEESTCRRVRCWQL